MKQSGIYLTLEIAKRLKFISLSSSGDFQGFLNAVFERLKQFLECCEYFLPTWLSSFDPRLFISILNTFTQALIEDQ